MLLVFSRLSFPSEHRKVGDSLIQLFTPFVIRRRAKSARNGLLSHKDRGKVRVDPISLLSGLYQYVVEHKARVIYLEVIELTVGNTVLYVS